jgi:hypothetical protein
MPKFKNCNLKIYSDNRTALKYINKAGGTASESLQNLAIEIQKLCNQYQVQLIYHHIPGIENKDADKLSRRKISLYEWTLPRRWFQQLQRQWGHQTFKIDAFAVRHNKKLRTYWSLLPDPEAQATDSFNQVWPQTGLYLNPPWKLIPRVIRKIQESKIKKAVLITPLWSTQFWWSLLFRSNIKQKFFYYIILSENKAWRERAYYHLIFSFHFGNWLIVVTDIIYAYVIIVILVATVIILIIVILIRYDRRM